MGFLKAEEGLTPLFTNESYNNFYSRAFIIAAAPGYNLPSFPEPQHAFSLSGLNLNVGNSKVIKPFRWDLLKIFVQKIFYQKSNQ